MGLLGVLVVVQRNKLYYHIDGTGQVSSMVVIEPWGRAPFES